MSKPDLTVAITGMNAKPDNPGPGLAVSRCLTESDDFKGRIVGLSLTLWIRDYILRNIVILAIFYPTHHQVTMLF